MKLNGKNAIITGASKGLGQAMAVALAAEGARVGLVSRDLAKLNEVAAQIRAIHGTRRCVVGSLTSRPAAPSRDNQADLRRPQGMAHGRFVRHANP